MTSHAKCAACLLSFALTGCVIHRSPTVPVVVYPPSPEAPASLQVVAAIEIPPGYMLIQAKPIYNMREDVQSIKQPTKRKKPSNRGLDIVAYPTDAIATPVPAISALGVITAGDPSALRRQTEESINSIERGLTGITRNMDDSEQKTADHVREFVKQAKAALASGDVDGAHTLAAKAKILLDELSK